MANDFSERTNDGRVPFRIHGGDLQTVEFDLFPGDRVYAEPGSVLCGVGDLDLGIDWGKSLMDPLKRKWAGEKALLQEITSEKGRGRLVIGAAQVGKILHIPLDGSKSIYCDKGSYLCHSGDIDITIGITTRIGAGLFAGNGFVMQRLTGVGDVFLHAMGSIIRWQLKQGVPAFAHTRNLLAFEDTVGYDFQRAGGFWSMVFGGQGLFFARLEGEGAVYCNSIDQHSFAQNLRGLRSRKDKHPASSGPETK